MERKENKMGVMPVKKLIVSMSLPMMISMMVQALYNVVDSIFVSRLGEDALTAVTVAYPLQMVMIAVGTGTGVGMNAILSRSLGEKRYERADKAADMGVFLTMINFVVFVILGIFAAKPFIASQTSNPNVLAYGTSYLRIVLCCCIGLQFQMIFERMLQSTGRTVYSMISQATGAIINIILDPILIFGLFGLPRLEVAGAAIATVIGQVVASLIGLILNLKKNEDVNITIKGVFSPDKAVIKEIYAVGVPSMLMMSIGSVMTYMMNLILKTFTETAIAVFGVYFKLQSFFFMPVFGLNNGLIPVMAYNYGAGRKDRIKEAFAFAMELAVGIMLVGMLVFMIFPGKLLGLFQASDEMLKIGVPALRTIAVSFPIAGLCIAMGSTFQAFSMSMYSLINSIARQLVVLIPVAWILSKFGNVNLVWWAFPISETVSLILSTIFLRKVLRTVYANIDRAAAQSAP